jgi:molybdate transport system substrate-binding protein
MIKCRIRSPAFVGQLLVALLTAVSLVAKADELNIAVAANFYGTLQELAPRFEQATGNKVLLSSGSSGQFYTQIKQGAPFDVLLSADSERPRQLEAEGLAVTGSRFTYAAGTLVLWSPQSQAVDSAGKVLLSGRFRMIGIADPANAPYGAAAAQVLKNLGIWEQLNRDKKLAFGENITQAWQFASTGNADMAFVALSQVTDGKIVSGSYWIPPQSLYTSIDQDAVVLARTTKRRTAEVFLTWLRHDPQAIAIIKAAGYSVKP